MSDVQVVRQSLRALADRIEIDALRGDFTDAGAMREYDRLGALFTEDAEWKIPLAGIGFAGREQIRAGIERMQGNWEFFIQNTHAGTVRVDGDTAIGRTYVAELGRMRDGSSHLNYAIYHDKYQRTADGWKFSERSYEIVYMDSSELPGTPWPEKAGD